MSSIPYYKLERTRPKLERLKILPPEIQPVYHLLPISFSDRSSDAAGFSSPPEHDRIRSLYHHYLADLLHAVVHQPLNLDPEQNPILQLDRSIEQIQPDFLIIEDCDRPGHRKKSTRSAYRHLIYQLPISTLILNTPRWPLEELLLVLTDGEPYNDAAIEWVGQFAQASQSGVTILVVLPPVPLMFGHRIQHSVPGLLRSLDPLGKKARWIANYFSEIGIKVTFKIRTGESEVQFWSQVFDSDPDMIFIAVHPHSLVREALSGENISSLLSYSDCPMMFVKHPA